MLLHLFRHNDIIEKKLQKNLHDKNNAYLCKGNF